jgi:hypothetical protein
LARDLAPFEVLGGGVNGESFLVLDEYAADDARIIGTAEVQDGIRDDADLLMRVQQGESRLGHGIKWQFFVSSFYRVLYGVREEIQLAAQMGEKGLVDLRKLELPLWERANNFISNGRRNGGSATVQKFDNLCHGENLLKSLEEAKTILWAKTRLRNGGFEAK